MIEFQVSTRHTGPKRRIKTFIYPSIEGLSRATRKRDGFYGMVQDEEGYYTRMSAITQYIDAAHIPGDQEPDDADFKPFITMRFARDRLLERPTEIIAHESTHAALFILRHDQPEAALFDDIEAQEKLCYLTGDITRKVVNKMYEKRILA